VELSSAFGTVLAEFKMSVVWEEANRWELAVLTPPVAQVPIESLAESGVNERYTDISHSSRFEERWTPALT